MRGEGVQKKPLSTFSQNGSWLFSILTIVVVPNVLSQNISHHLPLLLLSRFSRVRLCEPIDGSPPGSPIPGILQARTLEWVAISFSNASKWKVKVKFLSHVRFLATPWTAAHQAVHGIFQARVLEWGAIAFSQSSPRKLKYTEDSQLNRGLPL